MLSGRAMTDLGATAPLAFAAGLLSVLSPCVMPLMPAYLSMISGISVEEMRGGAQTAGARHRVMLGCLGFVSGFSTVFVVMGASAFAAGHLLRTWRAEVFGVEFGIAQVAGVFVILFGLHMTGLIPLNLLYRDAHFQYRMKQRSFLSTFLVGAGFAFGWSPCVGPILGTILTVAGSRETVHQGVALLAIYSAGLAVPFLAAGWSIDYFFRALESFKSHFRKLEVASGVVLMGVGVMLVTDQFSMLNRRFQFMTDFLSAAERALQ